MPKASKGARFYSADLHLHTPASHDYVDKTASAKDIVNAAITKKLDLIAVTDHNSAEWVDLVRDAAKKTGLIVLPGAEVSTPHCHILAIFDTNTPKSLIDDFLTRVGITTANRGQKEANSQPIEDVLNEIAKSGGIAIAAHANSSNGLLQQGSGQYRIKLCNDTRVCALEFTKQQHVDDFRQGRIPNYPCKACVQGSDSHSLTEIGTRRTFIKMDTPSVWSLSQALLDQDVRLRYSWNAAQDDHPYVLSMEVDQGFFGGTDFDFHSSLNCIVGGRGTGKSTALELMRFCFNDVSAIPEIAEDSQSKLNELLGPGGSVTVRFRDADGETKIVTRTFHDDDFEEDRSVKTDDGSDSELLMPPVFFSQGELTRIAREPMAQLELIDRYVDVEREHTEERRILRELRGNGAQLVKLQEQTDSVESDVTDKDVGLEATMKKYRELEKTLKDPVLRDYPHWESEGRYLQVAETELQQIEVEIDEFVAGLDVANRVSEPDSAYPNRKLLDDVPAVFERVQLDITAGIARLKEAFKRRKTELAAFRKKWQPQFDATRKSYEAALAKAGAENIKKAETQLRTLKRRLDDLERKAKGQASTLKEIQNLQASRVALRKELVKQRKSRFQKRTTKAAEWNKHFAGRIQVNIAEGADHSRYLEALRALTKGAMLRDPDLAAVASSCSPSRLVELVMSGDEGQLSRISGIKSDNARKLIENASTKGGSDLLDLETVVLPDVPDIRYEASVGNVRGLSQLSVGQKATVIISLALVEGDSPLVIDQPEEPLDTLAITNPVVDTLRNQKEVRQFIFTTHNPNVAVGADAELNIVLEASADKGSIASLGGIDHAATNKLLVLHLEGGPDAIERRVKKYRPQ